LFGQVLFLLYHYYEAREVYNAIRIFIAGYVWMTGFGNFSYYYKTGNYSFSRYTVASPRYRPSWLSISVENVCSMVGYRALP
jgi:hypothetical protein